MRVRLSSATLLCAAFASSVFSWGAAKTSAVRSFRTAPSAIVSYACAARSLRDWACDLVPRDLETLLVRRSTKEVLHDGN